MPLEHRTGKTFAKGRHYPLGATVTPDGVNFAVYSQHATDVFLLLFDEPDADPTDVIQLVNRDRFVSHALVRGLGPGQLYGYKARGDYRPEWGLRFNDSQAAAGPVREGGHGKIPQRRQPAARLRSAARRGRALSRYPRQHPHRSQVHRRRRCLRLAGREVTRPRPRGAGDLRSAPEGFYRPPVLRRRAGRDVSRVHREDPPSRPARHQRRRAPAGARVLRRRFPGAEGSDQLLGLQLDRVLRTRVVLCVRPDAGLPGGRVQDPGSRAAQGGHQGDPRCRLQPHGRRERDGTEPVLQGPGQPGLLLSDRAGRRAATLLHELHRLRQQPQLRQPRRHQAGHGLAALLDRGHARGRFPFRPGLGPRPRRPGRRVPVVLLVLRRRLAGSGAEPGRS